MSQAIVQQYFQEDAQLNTLHYVLMEHADLIKTPAHHNLDALLDIDYVLIKHVWIEMF